jgi:hypothetical protein
VPPWVRVCVQAAKRQALGRGEKVEMVETDWRWWPAKFVDQNPYRVCRQGCKAGPAAAEMGCTGGEAGGGLAGAQTPAAAAAASMTALTYTLPLPLCPDWQDVTPAPNSVIDLLLRATNKETGRGLTDVQIAAQCNTLIAGKAARGGALRGAACSTAQHSTAQQGLLVPPPL